MMADHMMAPLYCICYAMLALALALALTDSVRRLSSGQRGI